MSRPKQFPDDVRKVCIQIVCGYHRRRQEYLLRRSELISNRSDNIITIRDKEDPDNEELHEGVYISGSHTASRTTENIAEQVLGLEDLPETKRMRAVEYATKRVRRDLSELMRKKLVDAIYLNCKSGKKYPYKVLDVEGFSERGFYRERDKFLLDIAIFLELV
ncbi:MAG: hypothetical protein IKT52_13810 [Oscillospiraceae bacterium]|nr:hypothetical protein [Oscillospiraceae bacterium]